jgi:glycosyltransferase involved in cell wall biosynthesis
MGKSKKLLIISHTEHYYDESNIIVGWGPTIREINCLLRLFDEIWHIAPLYDVKAPASAIPYTKTCTFHFIPIKPTGGHTVFKKIDILYNFIYIIPLLRRTLKKVDYFQFRAPTGIGVILIPLLSLMTNKKGWFKYAGNWAEINSPWSYKFQRFYLSNLQNRIVTINGIWPDQKKHLISFENPCLTVDNRIEGKSSFVSKNFKNKYNLCFVGHLTISKGADYLLNALRDLRFSSLIDTFHIIGSGELLNDFVELQNKVNFKVIMHNYIPNNQVHDLFKICHFLVLPSRSEGFPKVVAEAANYGCIPVVSDISAIGQIVSHEFNGFLLSPIRLKNGLLNDDLYDILRCKNLNKIAYESFLMGELFTFHRYSNRISDLILNAC